jgi:Zn-dependent peptidase ImmA (M78 family)
MKPKTFKIDKEVWQVRLATQEILQERYKDGHGKHSAKTLCGVCLYDTRQILIDEKLTSDQKVATVRHELLHAFCPTMTEKRVVQLERLIQSAGEFV